MQCVTLCWCVTHCPKWIGNKLWKGFSQQTVRAVCSVVTAASSARQLGFYPSYPAARMCRTVSLKRLTSTVATANGMRLSCRPPHTSIWTFAHCPPHGNSPQGTYPCACQMCDVPMTLSTAMFDNLAHNPSATSPAQATKTIIWHTHQTKGVRHNSTTPSTDVAQHGPLTEAAAAVRDQHAWTQAASDGAHTIQTGISVNNNRAAVQVLARPSQPSRKPNIRASVGLAAKCKYQPCWTIQH